MPVKLSTPRIMVIRESDPEKALEVQTTNADLVLWDKTRLKHRWPKFEDAPFMWLTFISWAGARRAGLIPPGYAYETWERDVLEARVADDDDTDDETGAPFPTGLAGEVDSGARPSDVHGAP